MHDSTSSKNRKFSTRNTDTTTMQLENSIETDHKANYLASFVSPSLAILVHLPQYWYLNYYVLHSPPSLATERASLPSASIRTCPTFPRHTRPNRRRDGRLTRVPCGEYFRYITQQGQGYKNRRTVLFFSMTGGDGRKFDSKEMLMEVVSSR